MVRNDSRLLIRNGEVPTEEVKITPLIIAGIVILVFLVFIIIALCFYTSYHKTLVQERAQVQLKIMETREKKKEDTNAAKDAYERVIA